MEMDTTSELLRQGIIGGTYINANKKKGRI